MFGKDDRLDIPTNREIGDHTHPARGKQCNQIIEDRIGCRLMADLPIAIRVDVQF